MPSKVGSIDDGRSGSASSIIHSPRTPSSALSSPTSTIGPASSVTSAGGPTNRAHLASQRKASNRSLGTVFSAGPGSSATLPSRKSSVAAAYPPPASIKDGMEPEERDNVSVIAEMEKDAKTEGSQKGKDAKGTNAVKEVYIRQKPHVHTHSAEAAPPTLMYWSRAPVWGRMPSRPLRAHSVTMVDHVAWIFGGCDEKDCYRDLWCLDTETMEWTKPDVLGDIPPPCRAHTSTLIDRKLFVFGGGAGSTYYNSLYVFDTITHRWSHPKFPADSPTPAPRRAHSAVLHRNKLIVFGGGNGTAALNDVWVLDVHADPERMRWRQLETKGRMPNPRGYHTANLVGDVMVIVGGSDGRTSYSDIWCLNLESRNWSIIRPHRVYRRLAHTATQIGSYLFISGGHDGTKYLNELLLFNLVSLQFEPRLAIGRQPANRGYHAATLSDGRLFVFSGFNGQSYFDDVFILELAACAYLPQVTSFQIKVD